MDLNDCEYPRWRIEQKEGTDFEHHPGLLVAPVRTSLLQIVNALRDVAHTWPAPDCGANFALAAAENWLQFYPQHQAEILSSLRDSISSRVGVRLDAGRLCLLPLANQELISSLTIVGALDDPLHGQSLDVSILHLAESTASFVDRLAEWIVPRESLSLSFTNEDEFHLWLTHRRIARWGQIRDLELEHPIPTDQWRGAAQLFADLPLESFRSYDLPLNVLKDESMKNLTSLRVDGASHRQAILNQLATMSIAQNIQTLHLGGSVNDARGLLDEPLKCFLKRADSLKTLEVPGGWQVVGNSGLQALAAGPNAASLQRLSLIQHNFSDLETLRAWTGDFPALTELDLSHCDLTHVGLRLLLREGRFPALRALRLRGNPLGDDGLAAIAGWDGWQRLDELDVSNCQLTGERNCHYPPTNLRRLDMGSNAFSAVGYRHLIDGGVFKEVELLNISGTPLRANELVELLMQASALQVLLCCDCGIDDDLLRQLRSIPHDRLRVLSLEFNRQIGDRGCEALGESAWAQQLMALRIGHNFEITETGLTQMLHQQQLPLLQCLRIWGLEFDRPDLLPSELLHRFKQLATLETSSAALCAKIDRVLPLCGPICRRL